ncbi:hypothetical protein BDF14DRAFT_1865912, partial [Spinellus fusiger]
MGNITYCLFALYLRVHCYNYYIIILILILLEHATVLYELSYKQKYFIAQIYSDKIKLIHSTQSIIFFFIQIKTAFNLFPSIAHPNICLGRNPYPSFYCRI